MDDYTPQLRAQIAQECSEYENIASVHIGMSMANLSGDESPSCDYCVHWLGGSCSIFLSELYSLRS